MNEAETIHRYMKEKYGYDQDIAEIIQDPRPERMWNLAIALAYFREKNHFERIEDAPDGIEWITIADGKTVRNYQWMVSHEGENKGKLCYVVMNVITRGDYDKFYG